MIATLLALVPTTLAPTAALATPADLGSAPSMQVSALADGEYDKRLEEAGKDVGKLWDLYLWCDSTERPREARKTLLKIIKEDPDHKEAREKLGHSYYDGKWFKTDKKLEAYKKSEEERIAKEKGLVRYEGEWVDPEDIPFLERGLMRDGDGKWVSKEDHEKQQAGWVRQDLVWVSPEELPNIDKGLWKCDDQWLSEEDANTFHAEINRWWKIPADTFVLWTTCDRKVAEEIIGEIERGIRGMSRIYGRFPEAPFHVIVLRSADQYGEFASGVEHRGHPQTEIRALSSVHYAFFAEAYFSNTGEYLGTGAGYWDASTENGAQWGRHSVRLAAGYSFAEALDPSPKAIEKARKSGISESWMDRFLEEKRVPAWFSQGAATYIERYYEDNLVGQGGNPFWPREWSIGNIQNKGGLDGLDKIFELRLSVDNENSGKLMNEAGLLMAFILDGNCGPVKAKHAEIKAKLKAGDDVKSAFKELEKAITAHEKELRKFADL